MAWVDLADILIGRNDAELYAHGPDMRRADFIDASLAAAGALHARGARRAGLWFEDAAQLAVALFACWRAGVVAVLASDALPASCAALDADLDLWLTDNAELPVAGARRNLLESLYGAAPALAACALDLDSAGVVMCTSGSSGQPKLIAKRWRQLAAEIQALEQQWRWADTPACVLGSVSAQHMYGLPFRVLWPLCAGRSIERLQRVYPEALQQATLAHAASVWIVSPALLKRLGHALDWQALAPRLRQIVSSGGPLPPETSEEVTRGLQCSPTEIYGSSETGAVAYRQHGRSWQLLPGVQVGVNDEGALWVQSAWLDGDGVFQSQDAAVLEEQGFQLHGRLDRIIKIEEKRIALAALERALADHSYVREARLGLMPPGRRLTALVALSPLGRHALRNQGRKAVSAALHAHMSPQAPALAIPRHWRFVQELPWNAQGKLPQRDFEAAAVRPSTPTIRSREPVADSTGEYRLVLGVPLDLRQFNGHFAQVPVVPGVVQIGWAMALAREHLCPTLDFLGMEALKFQRLMRPGDEIDLSLKWDRTRAKLYFAFRMADQPCSSGRIVTGQPS
jgi:acyl-coenzyme A synthetase/AMP-(fatty) acid ligase/3-hydroxymyristoyl/3-hydroxydecanoyl-(acyl carrier protein) dehydratase